jgi:mannose-1-phosphate guanylyltransferase
MNNTYVAIMAGGVGSRFWPSSRTAKPKQFLDIMGVGKSLLRLTFERFLSVCPAENIYIVTNLDYIDLVKEQLPEIGANQILAEPSRNNTAPCVAYTALKLHALNPKANFVVAPSDHIILNEAKFVAEIQKALDYTAENDALVTLGITPSRPDTGYGYIRFEDNIGFHNRDESIHKVIQFTEKPPYEKAVEYVNSGQYVWNAGIFVWSTKSILKSFKENAPEILEILDDSKKVFNTDAEQAFINEAYPRTPNISIDYAIMERANNVFTIPTEFGWSDLGTWGSLHAEAPKDDQGNAINAPLALISDSSNCLIKASAKKLVVINGLDDYIVVDEDDVLMIYPKSKEQEIKQVTAEVAREIGGSYL